MYMTIIMETLNITPERFQQALAWMNGKPSTLGEKEVLQLLRSLTGRFQENCRTLRPGPVAVFRNLRLRPHPLSMAAIMQETGERLEKEKAEAEEAAKAEAGQGENPYLKDLLSKEDTPEDAPKEPSVEPTPEQAVMEKVAEENRLDSVLLINAIAYIAGMAGCPLTRSKAQIILYCLYGAHLAAGERLPMEHPQVWKYGPVFPRAFKRGDPEDRAACEAAYGELLQRAPALLVEISTRTQAMMGTPMADLNAVHKGERSPYGKTRARYPEKWGMPIPDEEIAEFFRMKTGG